jgi:flagella basal body P-ring formation protein FlgA
VQAPIAVAANGPLDISYTDGVVALSVRGTATRAASVGEHITARLDDHRQLDVIIIAPGRARIL